MTAEEFARRRNDEPEELLRGRVGPRTRPNRRHGQVGNEIGRILGNFAKEHDLGHVLSNDAGVITERTPDTVCGPDIAFYSYERLPKDPLPPSYGPEVPEVVFKVLSPNDRWPRVLAKVAEYLEAGVRVVVVLDEPPAMARVFHTDGFTRELGPDDALSVPEIPGFAVPVRVFFE